MAIPPLRKGTSATVELVPYFGFQGEPLAIVIIKEKFAVDRRFHVSRIGGAEVRYADVPWDEDAPETSSIRYPADVSLYKVSTDVLVIGAAMAPYREPVKELQVIVEVGPVSKSLYVTGPRVWFKGLTGLALGSPAPFEEVPLRWEFAYGGSDFEEGKKPLEEPRNPVGRGVARDPSSLVHKVGPQVEEFHERIGGFGSRTAPAGVGPIGRHWVPRRNYVGTIDERWMEERMPLLPLDHDMRFNQVAPPELITPRFLRGGETVRILHMNELGPLSFELPKLHFFVGSRTDRHGLVEHPSHLDTVLIEPNARTVELTYRAFVPLPRKLHEMHYIQVHEKRVL